MDEQSPRRRRRTETHIETQQIEENDKTLLQVNKGQGGCDQKQAPAFTSKKNPNYSKRKSKCTPMLIAIIIIEGLFIALLMCVVFLYAQNGWIPQGASARSLISTPTPVPTATPIPTPKKEYIFITPEPTEIPTPTPIITPVVEYVYITPEPTTPTPTSAFPTTDEYTQKYEEWALYILNDVYNESWKNPSSLQIHGMSIYLFDDGFEKEYSYYRENKGRTEKETVTSEMVFFDVDYSAQNGFGGMNRDYLAYKFRPDSYQDAKETGNVISKIIACAGGDEDTWVYPLLQSIKRDTGAYTKHKLDIDYLIAKHHSNQVD